MPSTSPFILVACDVRGLYFTLYSVMISLFINSVPLSVTRISGNSNFAIQRS